MKNLSRTLAVALTLLLSACGPGPKEVGYRFAYVEKLEVIAHPYEPIPERTNRFTIVVRVTPNDEFVRSRHFELQYGTYEVWEDGESETMPRLTSPRMGSHCGQGEAFTCTLEFETPTYPYLNAYARDHYLWLNHKRLFDLR